MKIVDEFKAFAMRGNVVDMAVGIVIGGAFGKIVSSLVAQVIMPPIGYITGGVDFGSLKVVLKDAVTDAAGAVTAPEVAISYGAFANTIIDFVIIAFALFAVIKVMNAAKRKPAPPPPPPEPTREEALLAEIRDILKAR
jgi:large conductance mechanosensitive channel